MQTKYIILIGVVGVGGVVAYMYMKNKQAQNALLGALPTTNQGGATTSGTTTSGTTTSGTTPPLSTTSDGITPSDANVNLANATILAGELKVQLDFIKRNRAKYGNNLNTVKRVELENQLSKLGYKVDANGSLVRI